MSASEAKTHFGTLIDKAQREPVTIEKMGRPIAVMVSFDDYLEQTRRGPSEAERTAAIEFLEKWGEQPPSEIGHETLQEDQRAQAILDKYNRSA